MKVFIDTSAWIALLSKRDALHIAAKRIMENVRQQNASLFTTHFVLIEVADALCKPPRRQITIVYLNRLRSLDNLTIVPLEETLLENPWHLYCQRLDKDWELTDCTSFIVMWQENITDAFTSDRHFEQAGFVKLL